MLFILPLCANVSVPGDRYEVMKNAKVEVFYTKEHEALAKEVLDFEDAVIATYTDSFGYSLDDTQYLGLLSSHNQVANAYSTQLPFNLQMNFVGGAMVPDYFATNSWIKTLLLHESAHNFQMNPKKNPLSRYAHKIVKNSFFTSLVFLPIFPIPNLAESSFVLEGNAVLNESWHNNGGRLYNGAMLAMAITQAQRGYITPERTYNNHLYFPYGAHHYIVGGFFQLFLAQRFGIDKTNSYFYNFSGQYLPIFTNSVFKETFGEDFETLLAEYSDWLQTSYTGFKASEGAVLLRSQYNIPFNSDSDEIYFLTSDNYTKPTLVRLDKKSGKVQQKKMDLPIGKVFKHGENFYTRASRHTSPKAIMIGLYDGEGKIVSGTSSKAVQAWHGESMVYFDVPSSFDTPELYVDGVYKGAVNSSVFSDYHDRLYYFKQEGKWRTLYRDGEKLFSFKGYYGFVCDVLGEKVYFVSNTQNGSGLYSYESGNVMRVLDGEDVVDARLIDANTALVESIDSEGLAIRRLVLSPRTASVFEVRYFFEDDKRFMLEIPKGKHPSSEVYTPMDNLHYSSLSQSFVFNGDSVDFDLNAGFTDPLSQNKVSLFMNKTGDESIAGLGYDSSEYRLNFGARVFGTISQEDSVDSRGFGSYLYMKYPLFKETYKKMDMQLSYLLPDDKDARSPLTWSLAYKHHKHYGQSMYLNYANDFSMAVGLDRSDKAVGASYERKEGFDHQLYANFNLKAAVTDSQSGKKHGLLVTRYQNRFSDALAFEMGSLPHDIYVKDIVNAGVGVQKVFDVDKYFFSFPISLRREALYAKYNYYNMHFLNEAEEDFHEMTVGIRADLLYFNSLAVPVSMEYIYNDEIQNANHFRVVFDLRL